MNMKERLYVAVDTPRASDATALVGAVRPHVGGLKIGLEFFVANGPAWVQRMSGYSLPVFLDLKLHDTPRTVAAAVHEICHSMPGVAIISMHASGGPYMMEAAMEAVSKIRGKRPKIVAATVLTSMDGDDLDDVGQVGPVTSQVLQLAALAHQSGLDGVVCSAHEAAAVREFLGPDFLVVCPDIRPFWSTTGFADQKRTMGPTGAVTAGADIVVVGRPITEAKRPDEAAARIVKELEEIKQ